uniref:Uncharacterized protein n=1 Tax=Arundo donax TaxID=35708 RepID=A0A0A8YBH8_ARUDO
MTRWKEAPGKLMATDR